MSQKSLPSFGDDWILINLDAFCVLIKKNIRATCASIFWAGATGFWAGSLFVGQVGEKLSV